MPKNDNIENLLVGLDTADDAVYKLNDDMALIQTLDFFTPMVDDPYVFGQILHQIHYQMYMLWEANLWLL